MSTHVDTPLSVLGTPMLVVEYSLSSVSLKYPMLPLASLPHICCTTDTARVCVWVEREVGKGGGGEEVASTMTVANMITHILNCGTFHMS